MVITFSVYPLIYQTLD